MTKQGIPQRILLKTSGLAAKNRDGRKIVNRHIFFFLALLVGKYFLFSISAAFLTQTVCLIDTTVKFEIFLLSISAAFLTQTVCLDDATVKFETCTSTFCFSRISHG